MSMNTEYLNTIAQAGADNIDFIGVVDDLGEVIEYQSVTWSSPVDGQINLASNISFNIPADTTVTGWRGFDDSTGTTEYGGADFDTVETFSNSGELILESEGTYIDHSVTA